MQPSTCTTCGAAMTPGTGFCGACGRAAGFAPPPQQQPMYGHGAPAHPPTGYAPPQQPQQPQQQQQPMYGGPGFAPPQQPPPQGYPPPQGQGFAPGQQSPYPAAQYPPPQYPPPQYPPPPAAHTATAWKWGYSRWIGITYGPIPVGIIIAVIILIAVYGK